MIFQRLAQARLPVGSVLSNASAGGVLGYCKPDDNMHPRSDGKPSFSSQSRVI
jgi:hypothetical protein